MATDVLKRLRAMDPAAAMPEPDADERERLRRAIVATPLDPRAARRWPRLRGRTLAVLVAGAVLLGGGAVYAGDVALTGRSRVEVQDGRHDRRCCRPSGQLGWGGLCRQL